MLAIAIRQHSDIAGVEFPDGQCKLSAYADDLLLFLKPDSLPSVLQLIDNYSALSGYKVNLTKTTLIPLNTHVHKTELQAYPFQYAQSSFKYLGVEYGFTLQDTITINIRACKTLVNECIHKWTPLHLTWWGKLETIKMMLVPKISYVLSMIPVLFASSFYKHLNRLIVSFLWGNRVPRIAAWKLRLPKAKGGVHLPDVEWLHLASLL